MAKNTLLWYLSTVGHIQLLGMMSTSAEALSFSLAVMSQGAVSLQRSKMPYLFQGTAKDVPDRYAAICALLSAVGIVGAVISSEDVVAFYVVKELL